MDKSKSSSQQSSLDSLRTVEFRQTLRGYHIDDVDEYLERVAVDAEALQEQMRQSGERMRQAAERIAQLERQQLQQVQAQPPTGVPVGRRRRCSAPCCWPRSSWTRPRPKPRPRPARLWPMPRSGPGHWWPTPSSGPAPSPRRPSVTCARTSPGWSPFARKLAGDVETIARHLETERNRVARALWATCSPGWTSTCSRRRRCWPSRPSLAVTGDSRRRPGDRTGAAARSQGSLLRTPDAGFNAPRPTPRATPQCNRAAPPGR